MFYQNFYSGRLNIYWVYYILNKLQKKIIRKIYTCKVHSFLVYKEVLRELKNFLQKLTLDFKTRKINKTIIFKLKYSAYTVCIHCKICIDFMSTVYKLKIYRVYV